MSSPRAACVTPRQHSGFPPASNTQPSHRLHARHFLLLITSLSIPLIPFILYFRCCMWTFCANTRENIGLAAVHFHVVGRLNTLWKPVDFAAPFVFLSDIYNLIELKQHFTFLTALRRPKNPPERSVPSSLHAAQAAGSAAFSAVCFSLKPHTTQPALRRRLSL